MAWQQFKDETTLDLIEYMKWGSDQHEKNVADDAFIVFCFRFRDDVQRKMRIVAGSWGYDSVTADEIATKIFSRFRKYHSFEPAECKAKEIDTCVKLYLYKIGQRLLSDHKANLEEGNPFIGDEEIIRDFPNLDILTIPVEKKAIIIKNYEIIKNALDRLTPKHKIIYLTYKTYEAHLKEGFNLPRHLLQALRKELKISQATIRVNKKEAFDKIEEYLKIYGSK